MALGILAAVAAIVLGGLIAGAWWARQRYASAYAVEAARLDGYRQIIATRTDTETKLKAVRAREARQLFLKNHGPALGASELQDAARLMIESGGGKVITSQIPAHKDEGKYRQVTVNLMFAASLPALRKVLHAIEAARPSIFVDNFTVRSNYGFGFRPTPGVEPELTIQLDVIAYALIP